MIEVFTEPKTELQHRIRNYTISIANKMLDGYSLSYSAKTSGLSWTSTNVRKMILSDDIFYNIYIDHMAKKGSLIGIIEREAIERRGKDFVMNLHVKSRRA